MTFLDSEEFEISRRRSAVGVGVCCKHVRNQVLAALSALIILLAALVLLLAGCCGFPIVGKCSTKSEVYLDFVADSICNGGNSLQVIIYTVRDTPLFLNAPSRMLFAAQLDSIGYAELGVNPGPIEAFVAPGESVQKVLDLDQGLLSRHAPPLFLGVIGNFAAPASPTSGRLVYCLSGGKSPYRFRVKLTSNMMVDISNP